MPSITSLLGEEIQFKEDLKVDITTWSKPGKVIGLYFSAHWCPPCKAFTPILADWYKEFKNSENKENLEIVFVSSDRDQKAFDEYYSEQPWHALPYSDRDRKSKLSAKFKVQGIPMLVFIQADTGKLITTNGREKVMGKADISEFPWYPKSLKEILSGKVLKHGDDNTVQEIDMQEAIQGKKLGIYFSAHWCPPCKGFTPMLAKTYNKLKEDSKDFEVIFVSSDKDSASFSDYWKTMPWLAIPHGDKRKNMLSEHFEVEGIPDLQILDENLEIITGEGRGAVTADPEGKDFPWTPKPLNPLLGHTAGQINTTATLVYLTGDKEQQDKAAELLQDIAENYTKDFKEKADDDEFPNLGFLHEVEDSEDMVDSLRDFLKLGDVDPLIVIVNIPEQKKYLHKGDISKENIQDIVTKFKNGSLEFSALR